MDSSSIPSINEFPLDNGLFIKSWYTIARLTTIGMFVRKGNGDGETLDNRDPIQTFDSVVPTIILRCTLNFIRVFGIITWNSNNTANIYYRFCNLL